MNDATHWLVCCLPLWYPLSLMWFQFRGSCISKNAKNAENSTFGCSFLLWRKCKDPGQRFLQLLHQALHEILSISSSISMTMSWQISDTSNPVLVRYRNPTSNTAAQRISSSAIFVKGSHRRPKSTTGMKVNDIGISIHFYRFCTRFEIQHGLWHWAQRP